MKTELTSRFTAALEYARIAHGPQRRKGTDIPYLSHVIGVASLVLEYDGDEDQAIAGLLHDVLEDCGAHHEPVIRERFGDRVAEIVLSCTDGVPDARGEKTDWQQRKARYLAHLLTVSEDALLVSTADKLHNARAIVADLHAGHDVFARFKGGKEGTLWYYEQLVDIMSKRGGNWPIVMEFAATVATMRTTRCQDRAA